MSGPLRRDYDKRLYKKCIKCRGWKPRKDLELENGEVKKKGFGSHNSSDGLQSICFTCKNLANTESRKRNVTARIRHHTATRCLTQLGKLAPENLTAELEQYLGYRIKALVRHLREDLKDREGPQRKLRDALNEGYHIDHKRPLSSFNIIYMTQQGIHEVDWDEFRKCWDPSNLTAIPAQENLEKGAKYVGPSNEEETTEAEANEEVVHSEVEIVREVDIESSPLPDTRSSTYTKGLDND